jgi:hypothetical protein
MGSEAFELIFAVLFVAIAAISSFARARGGNALYWAGITAGGCAVLALSVIFFSARIDPDLSTRDETAVYSYLGLAGAWLSVVTIYVWVFLGRKRVKPAGVWSCPNCKYLNKEYALVCEACQAPFENSSRSY